MSFQMGLNCGFSLLFHFLHICVEWNYVWQKKIVCNRTFWQLPLPFKEVTPKFPLLFRLAHFIVFAYIFLNKKETCKKRVPTWFKQNLVFHTLIVVLLLYISLVYNAHSRRHNKSPTNCVWIFPSSFITMLEPYIVKSWMMIHSYITAVLVICLCSVDDLLGSSAGLNILG